MGAHATTRQPKWIVVGVVVASVVVTATAVIAFVTTSASSTRVTTPATTTPVTTSTGAAVNYGWELTATNTGLAGVGIDRNTLPVFTGTVTNGMTISNVKITQALDLSSHPNVTLDRVWVQVTDSGRAIIVGPGTTIRDSDLDGSKMPTGERFGISSQPSVGTTGSYTIQRNNITGMSVGIYLDSQGATGVGLVSGTYIHNMISTNGAHLDGFTRRSGTAPLTVIDSRIANDYSGSGGTWATGSIFLQTTWGGQIAGVTLQDSYFEGNGYVIGIGNTGPGISVGVNNVRLRPTEYGPINTSGNIAYTQWVNVNLYDPTKTNAAGAVVNHP